MRTTPQDQTVPSLRDDLAVRLRAEDGVHVELIAGPAGRDDVLWIDFGHRTDAEVMGAYLDELHPGIDPDLVQDLVERDDLARAEDRSGVLRHVSAVGFCVAETAPGAHGPGPVEFQMVEMLAGPGWVVTCWQDSERVCPDQGRSDGPPVLRDQVRQEVLDQWTAIGGGSAGDLGTVVCARLAHRYKRSYRTLERWLQEWEMAFHSGEKRDAGPVRHLLGVVNEARRRLAAFNNARSDTAGTGWFADLEHPQLDLTADKHLDEALDRLRLTFEHVRADMELVNMERLLEQAEESARRDAQERRFEKNLAKVTAIFLVPTLIAGVFGANTWVPGEHSWLGFDAMIALMLVTSFGVYRFLVRRDLRDDAADALHSASRPA